MMMISSQSFCPFTLHSVAELTPAAASLQQVYDRDLTTDDFMGSAVVTLSDLELDK